MNNSRRKFLTSTSALTAVICIRFASRSACASTSSRVCAASHTDVTVVSVSRMVHECLAAADVLAETLLRMWRAKHRAEQRGVVQPTPERRR